MAAPARHPEDLALKRRHPHWCRRALAVLALAGAPLATAGPACQQSPSAPHYTELAYWAWSLGASARQQVGHNDFVALPDGSGRHVFAATYAEHQQNVARYQSR